MCSNESQARVVWCGLRAGVLAVARTVVSQWTGASDRVRYMALLGVVQYIGFACTPIIGAQTVDFYLLGRERNAPPPLASCLLACFVCCAVLCCVVRCYDGTKRNVS
jgi:hypothetical protein